MPRTYFYCSSDGTRTTGGGTTVQRTGSFAAMAAEDKYRHPGTAIADPSPPVTGDIIVWDAGSSEAIPGNQTMTIPDGVMIVSADTNNCDQYQKATTPQVLQAVNNQYQLMTAPFATRGSFVAGTNYQTGDTQYMHANNASLIAFMHEATILMNNTASRFLYASRRGTGICAFKSEWGRGAVGGLTGGVFGNQSGYALLLGGVVDSYSGSMFRGGTEGFNARAYGVDMSNSTPSLIMDYTSGSNDALHVYACNLPGGWTSEQPISMGQTLIVEGSDSAYQYYERQFTGTIDFVTDVYYDAHDTLDDGLTKGSYEFETDTTHSSDILPLILGTGTSARFLSAVNTEASSKPKVRLRFVPASGDTLDDSDLLIYVGYAKAGTAHQLDWTCHWVSPLDAASPLPTEPTSTTWTGSGLSATAHYLDIDMGSPDNGRVIVMPAVIKNDVTVYFSWQLEFVA